MRKEQSELESNAVLVSFPGNEVMAARLANDLALTTISLEWHRFPDGESLVRIEGDLAGRPVLVLCTLDRPDDKLAPLLFTADAARDLGASRVGLVSPYLGYLRQDRRFRDGEAITSRTFARTLSGAFDWLTTVDPHLHRYHTLDAVYTIPSTVVHAAPALSAWIREHVASPLVIGPDGESAQWAGAVADVVGAPHMVLEKVRRGDRDVAVSLPDVARWRDRVPVLVDDIISSARTMAETVRHVRLAGLAAPVCVGVHAVLADDALTLLADAGAAEVVTSNTIAHPCNGIDVSMLLASSVDAWLKPRS